MNQTPNGRPLEGERGGGTPLCQKNKDEGDFPIPHREKGGRTGCNI